MKKLTSSLFALIFLAGVAGAFSVNIDPPSLWLSIPAGSSKTGTIIVENKGSEAINVNAYTEDWSFAANRSKVFKKAGTNQSSCSNWITLFPSNFTVEPGRSQDVRYTLTASADASGGYYSVIFFESKVGRAMSAGSNVIVAGRIGTIVYLNTAGRSERSAEAKEFRVSKADQAKPLYTTLTIANTGNTAISAEGSVIITDSTSRLYGKADIKKFFILQDETIPVRAQWFGRLDEGEYDVIATIDYGAPAPLVAAAKLTVTSKEKKKPAGR